jgi:hypothetical protein
MVSLATALAQTPQNPSPDEGEKAKQAAIIQRVRNGETRAILEESEIKPELSVPSLAVTVRNRSTNPERAELARQALSRVKGVEDYLKLKIDNLSGKQTGDVVAERCQQMETLSLIRSDKAIRTIALYLFDDKTPGFVGGGLALPSNKFAATVFLEDMKLQGAPSGPYKNSDERIAAWRSWWLKTKDKYEQPKMPKKP